MKKLFNLLACLLLTLSLCACSSDKYANGEVDIFLPGEYISDDVISEFEDEYKVKVNITLFDTNESMYTKLLTGAKFDIIIPSDYMIERLISEGYLQKLDKSKLTCLDSLYSEVRNMPYDPNEEYSVPYFWGNTGIVYDSTLIDQNDVETEGWSVLQDTKYKGMIYMYDSIRDVFMMAFKSLGYSMNTNDEKQINEAYDWLCKIADTMEPAYATDECIDGLAHGEKAMGFMYSGDAAFIISENSDMKFWSPTEGANYFVDAMVLQKDCENAENAYKFINYITDYDAAYENSSFVGYASVNSDVLNDISSEGSDFDGNEAYIPRPMNDKDETFSNQEELLDIISDLWVKVRNR